MQGIAIVGVGRIGGALAVAFSRAGLRVNELIVRDPCIAEKIKKRSVPKAKISTLKEVREIKASTVLICVDDPVIRSIGDQLNGVTRKGQVVLHTSGSLTSSVLEGLRSKGCETGSMHPLVSISDPLRGSKSFKNTYFCLEGTPKAVDSAEKLVSAIGGKSFTVPPEKKALYHAAAVTSAGHITALVDTAIDMLVECGLERNTASRVLLPLIESTVSNLRSGSTTDALTGSFARLDIEAVDRHLNAMSKSPRFLTVYLELGARSIEMVERGAGRSPESKALLERITVAKQKLR